MELKQPQTSAATITYTPDGQVLTENPARFIFMPEDDTAEGRTVSYTIEVSKNADFTELVHVQAGIPFNFYTPDAAFAPGSYVWRYKLDGGSTYSKSRTFTVPEGLTPTPLISRAKRYEHVSHAHPRLWMTAEQIAAFRQALAADPTYCRFDSFLEHSVLPATTYPFPTEPERFKNDRFEPADRDSYDLWQHNYRACHDAMVIIRNLTVAGMILENSNYIQQAKRCLLQIAAWDPNGSTSRAYHDECTFRLTYGMAFAYDWLYHELSDAERAAVLRNLLTYTRQIAEHAMLEKRIHVFPFKSHAVRSLSSVLVPASISMLFEIPEATEWLDYGIEYLATIFGPWGGSDGGWAEGPNYWTSATSYVLEAMDYLKEYMGIDIYKRPFFQNTGDFPLYCAADKATIACTFSDNNTDDPNELFSLKLGYNVRHFAAVTQNPVYQWYYEQSKQRQVYPYPPQFQNYYDDLFFNDVRFFQTYQTVTPQEPPMGRMAKWFKDIGWVAVHHNMPAEDKHFFFLTKSSFYGSASHNHGDQNGFILYAYGQPLLINGGYYRGYGSGMHLKYYRQTISHNTLLFDGKGQFTDMDEDNYYEEKYLAAKGHIQSVDETDGYVRIIADASLAYQDWVPHLESFVRTSYVMDETYVVLVDEVSFTQTAEVNLMLHALTSFQIEAQRFHVAGKKAGLHGQFVHVSAGIAALAETDQFEGLNAYETADHENQHHLRMDTKKAQQHTIVTLLCPVHTTETKMPVLVAQTGNGFVFTRNGIERFVPIHMS